ncbi:hypothetical protein LX73_2276 [Fodinibius salinus]|uniref:Uncharacterized protein n=1 Tax=Fodinibius salinus TaxID=860790 RepID=A0A5D3YIG7_9BACT|nr:hypothetical protein [Fodinibius salinus]TYP92030.1 hypothetical protein LX73_2276 [Fodinibius salinus]
MQQIIQRITQKFIDRLPDNDQYYRLDELRGWDFPPYIVQRIRIELERNLAESMIIPKTDWANTRSDAVLDAWQQFVDAIRAEARLPASYGKTVIETAVADVVEMLVQPCKTIPDVIFGSDESLSAEEINKRLQSVVVYRHFSRLILRYMQKKELDRLSKSRCKDIIREADQKLTKRYSPLNWAQMLDTLFKLLDGNIDSELLRLFFEDKNCPRVARHFDLMNKELSRAELIEELSSPDLLNFEGYEDEQSRLFEDQPAESAVDKNEQEIVKEENKKNQQIQNASDETQADKKETQNELQSSAEDDPEEVDIASTFAKQSKEQAKKDSDTSSEAQEEKGDTESTQSDSEENKEQKLKALNDAFAGQLNDETDEGTAVSKVSEVEKSDAEQEESDDELDPSEPAESKNAEADNTSGDNVPGNTEKETSGEEDQPSEAKEVDDKEESEGDLQEEKEAASQTNGQQEDENPMWMRFVSDEEMGEYREEQEAEDEGFIEDPIIDLTSEDTLDNEVEELADLLEGDRELFVEEIFGGSERAFDSAVEDIAAYSSWSDASKYIEKDIFKRNLVDVYSEAAVDFTDQLQSYFLEKENRN